MTGQSSKTKGSAWERKVAIELSLWVTRGARADIFARSIGSGSRFTRAAARLAETATPGDLIAAHEMAFPFLRLFMVECKHRKNISISDLIFNGVSGKSFLAVTIAKAKQEADTAGLHWMVIAKQDHKEPLVLISGEHCAMASDRGICAVAMPFSYVDDPIKNISIMIIRLIDLTKYAKWKEWHKLLTADNL